MNQCHVKCGHDESIDRWNNPYCVVDAALPQKIKIETEAQKSEETKAEKRSSDIVWHFSDGDAVYPKLHWRNKSFHIPESRLDLATEETDTVDARKPPITPSEVVNVPFPPKESTKKQIPLYPLQTLNARKKARQERREERRKLKLKLEEENKKLAAKLTELQATTAKLQSQICSSCFTQIQQYLYSHKDNAPNDDYRFELRKCSDSGCKGNNNANLESMVQNLGI
uniref:BZIP domain-containing protein n=1 Tax=Panagrellus redivivus TaxID=6233 RepID=A0A7E4VD49_PANRE